MSRCNVYSCRSERGIPTSAGVCAEPLSFVLFIPSVVCGYLAYWQYQRSMWKGGLIAEREAGLKSPARDIYDLDELHDHAKVSCSGRYIHERSLFVGPRPRSIPGRGIQSGYFLITPLYQPDRKGAVLVNRGWVPGSWLDDIPKVAAAHDAQPGPAPPTSAPPDQPAMAQAGAATSSSSSSSGGGAGSHSQGDAGSAASSPAPPPPRGWAAWFGRGHEPPQPAAKTAGQAQGQGPAPPAPPTPPLIHVVGVVQPSERPSAVLPDNVPDKLEFRWVEVPALARVVGLPPDTPLVQAISEDPDTLQSVAKDANPMKLAGQITSSAFMGGPLQYPIPKNAGDLLTFSTMPKDHLVYAGIWASLCVALGFMARHAVFNPPKLYRMIGTTNKDIWAAQQGGQTS
ncbi:SURF1 family-domain-containing protein [Haematococcus lacustris]